jgi:nucleoside-diphosphate-sugar epimerase
MSPPDNRDLRINASGEAVDDWVVREVKANPVNGLRGPKVPKETLQSDVDVRWLAAAGARMGSAGTPRFPLVVGGSGMTGSNMIVLLANTLGCERIRVLDRVPPRKAVLADCPVLEKKLDFVQHFLSEDSEEELLKAFKGVDCVFSIITPDVMYATEEQFYRTNVDGIKLLLSAAVAEKVPRFVFLSSIAVTNHFADSRNMSEADALPPLDSLESPYDRTKSIAERLVLEANGTNGMVTCSLRAGGILLSPTDYTFRNYFMIPGILFGIHNNALIDFISGQDVARGLLLAAKALEHRTADVAGEAFFLTKGYSCEPATLMYTASEFLGWPTVNLWEVFYQAGVLFQKLFHETKEKLGMPTPGIPPHKFWKMGRIEQTFDNSKARDVLGYAPEVSMRDCLWHICACHRRDLEARGIRPMPWLVVFAEPKFWLGALSLVGITACLRWRGRP